MKLTKNDVQELFAERLAIETWLNPPPPDPSVWPPAGWVLNGVDGKGEACYSRRLTESELRKELFGDPDRAEWEMHAINRKAEIDELLKPYFFPKAKEEGTQRVTKGGFVAMLKTGLKRKLDVAALAIVIAKCQEVATEKKYDFSVEEKLIDWKPSLKLTEYRELPKAIRDEFDNALDVTPEKPVFEIVKESQESA